MRPVDANALYRQAASTLARIALMNTYGVDRCLHSDGIPAWDENGRPTT